MEKLETTIGTIRMDTPLMAVSGIYGYEYERLIRSKRHIGAVVTKSVTLLPRDGNPEPRILETRAGVLNSVGLPNPGIDAFLTTEIPRLRFVEVPIIASVAGFSIDEYVTCSGRLDACDGIEGIELNVSCPNVDTGGIEFGCDARVLEKLVSSVRAVVKDKTLIVKLTPNVTDIATIASAAIDGGADAISLINTLRGMAIDLEDQKPKLGNRVGGLSGIGVHPVAVYMIHQCYVSCCRKADIPIIGIGGVVDSDYAIEFILAGATCVGVGTAMFRDEMFRDEREKDLFEDIVDGMTDYLTEKDEVDIAAIVGKAAVGE